MAVSEDDLEHLRWCADLARIAHPELAIVRWAVETLTPITTVAPGALSTGRPRNWLRL